MKLKNISNAKRKHAICGTWEEQMDKIAELEKARNAAMDRVRAWWDAEQLNGRFREHTSAPAWPEYLAAFAALDSAAQVNK